MSVMSDICRVIHAQKTCLPSKVSMSGSCEKVVYFSIHQRRGFKQGYPDTVRQLFRLPYTKHLASSQGFGVRLLSGCYTGFYASKSLRSCIFPPLKTDIQSE